jgi:hypothetical protein
MIDLNALDNDPWATIPVKKEDLRALAAAMQNMERELQNVMVDAKILYETLSVIAAQNEEPLSRRVARRALGLEQVKDSGFIL